jgi:hypothetical protein
MILSVNAELQMFNPRPTIRYVPIGGNHACAVIDDFLAEPHKLVAYAAEQRDRFAIDPDNFYPGPELGLGPEFAAALAQFFSLHIRQSLGARRVLHASARLAMATLPGSQLSGLQRLCHRDAMTLPAGEGVAASVAYLFDREELGGTSFYAPRKSLEETAGYLQRVAAGEPVPRPGYMNSSDNWFEQTCTVPARFNRAIFYDGTVFHAAQIDNPDLLASDFACARLTMNGFFRVRKSAAHGQGAPHSR